MSGPQIAVIGLACRVPGAAGPRAFWSLLREGREAIRRFDAAQLAAAGVAAALRQRADYVPACGVLDGIELFDAAFFGIPPREATLLDPQHRIFLELAWEALEDAGCDPERYPGRIGVYAGAGLSTYLINNLLPASGLERCAAPLQVLMANNKDYLPTRASYRLNLRGPSVSVNTACSTSLVAVHIACQALLNHECDVALAGGLGIQVPQQRGYLYEPEGILSPDGHCRAFDARAAGTVSGNGGGLVVLKRFAEARAERDAIRALILGTAINNDGARKAGYTAPSVAGQAEVIAEALGVAGVAPASLGYIEAHGTGTAVGDPIEIEALAQVFGAAAAEGPRCAIGSVKSNLGHLDEGAGVAGLIKTVLALEHGEIPATLHVTQPNPACGFERTPLYVNTAHRPWPAGAAPRRAGVSCFGLGGTNAHVVLQAGEKPAAIPPRRPACVLPVSARSAAAVAASAQALAQCLTENPELALADVAYTLQLGRRAFAQRRAIVCRDRDDACRQLRSVTAVHAAAPLPVVFSFPELGAADAAGCAELYAIEPAFAEAFDRAAAAVLRAGGPPLELAAAADAALAPALSFAAQHALAALWLHWGVQPAALIGAGRGEITAACSAGVLTLEDAARLVISNNAAAIVMRSPQTALMSSVRGDWFDPGACPPEDWRRLLDMPGRCAAGMHAIRARHPDAVFIELGASSVPHAAHAGLLQSLAGLWERGVSIAWERFAETAGRRVSLPTYPFERSRHWIEAPTPVAHEAAHEEEATTEVASWLYEPAWTPAPGSDSSVAAGTVLLLLPAAEDRADWLERLARELGRVAARVLRVVPAASYRKLAADHFEVPPAVPAAFERLLSECGLADGAPFSVVAAWLVSGARAVALEGLLQYGVDSLYCLVRACAARQMPQALVTLADASVAVAPTDRLSPCKAAVSGWLRAFALEQPGMCVRHIDAATTADAVPLRSLLVDVLEPTPGASVVAYRGTTRYRPVIRPLGARRAPAAAQPPIRDAGVYFITGGLGSMGLAFAEWIAARTRAATLVLAARPRATAAGGISLGELALRLRAPAPSIEPQHEERLALLDRLCGRLLLETFLQAGIPLHAGACVGLDEVQRSLAARPGYRRMVDWAIEVLVADGIVDCAGGVLRGRWDGGGAAAAELAARIQARCPELAGLADLLVHCAAHYLEVFAGRLEGAQVLYPDGSPALLERFSSRIGEYSADRSCLELAAAHLATLARARPHQPLRILEVGGGTGTFTEALLRQLGDTPVVLTFTDLSQAFVARAAQAARERGIEHMLFRRLDISRPPDVQGFAAEAFDVIAGYNVVHATPDLRQTLAHLRTLLAPGGTLCLIETTRTRRWDQMVWGLTQGWWVYADGLRRSSPLVALDTWRRVVADAGFEGVEVEPPAGAADAGVIVARQALNDTAAPRLQRLMAGGARVVVTQVDVTDAAALRGVVEQVQAEHGRVTGVIHTAGVIGGGLASDKPLHEWRRVLAPKLAGAQNLAAAFAGCAPEFFVLCSSLAAHLPTAGQSDYAAANAALDAFAHEYTRTTGPATSIGWGFWQELGMIARAVMPRVQQARIVREIHDKGWSQAGVAVLGEVLSRRLGPQVLVSPEPLAAPGEAPGEVPCELPRLLSSRVAAAGHVAYTVSFEAGLRWLLDEHRVAGRRILPGTGLLEIARAAHQAQHRIGSVEMREVTFVEPFAAADMEALPELCVLLQERDRHTDFIIASHTAGEDRWLLHARGELHPLVPAAASQATVRELPEAVPLPLAARMQGFGPHWSNLIGAHCIDAQGVALLELPQDFAHECAWLGLHPALLDNATGFLPIERQSEARVPFSYDCIKVYAALPRRIVASARAHGAAGSAEERFDVDITAEDGRLLVAVQGYCLRRLPPQIPLAASADNVALRLGTRGALDTLGLVAAARRAPGPEEVEVRVEASGLNFIEVLYALGMLPEMPDRELAFGLECAGVVTRIGSGVDSVQPGQRVAAFANGTGRLYALVPARALAVLPEGLSSSAAATIPAAYLTAYTALLEAARLRRGESVLIHSACGGVGLAAVHVARWLGASVLATAGTPEKREWLRQLGIGVVMDSHSTSFADETLAATAGRGVDVVLNSLAGEYLELGLSVLRPGGRFIELGKRDILAGRALPLTQFRRRLSFIAVDVGPDLEDFERLWLEVWTRVRHGDFPPLPLQVFSADRAQEAFAEMARGRHIGKLVVSFAAADALLRACAAPVIERRQPLAALLGARGGAADSITATALQPAGDAIEQAIAAIWQDLLGVSAVGLQDDFFALNGDSLVGAQVISRIHQRFGVKCPLSAIFDRPSVALLAELVRAKLAPAAHDVIEEGII